MLRATTACTFSTSQLPKVVRSWGVLYILTCKCASRHNGVQFFISHLASWLRTRRFSEPTFRPSGAPKSLEKHSVSRLSYLFAHLHLLSSYSFSSTLLSSNLSLLSASSLLCFSSVHIVGSLTSKLPSTIGIYISVGHSHIWMDRKQQIYADVYVIRITERPRLESNLRKIGKQPWGAESWKWGCDPQKNVGGFANFLWPKMGKKKWVGTSQDWLVGWNSS